MKLIQGNLIAKDMKVGIVAARFNDFIVGKLIEGAEDALLRHGVDGDNIGYDVAMAAIEMVNLSAEINGINK
jgi:6,7-dimethyl-8-ribityllumazine synthase